MGKDHSPTIGYWIKGGLRYIDVSGRRFFWEHEVIEFFLERQRRQKESGENEKE